MEVVAVLAVEVVVMGVVYFIIILFIHVILFNTVPVWQWQTDTLDWEDYDSIVSKFLEQTFQEGKTKKLDLSQIYTNMPYKINFEKLEQKRLKTGKKRSIRRLDAKHGSLGKWQNDKMSYY